MANGYRVITPCSRFVFCDHRFDSLDKELIQYFFYLRRIKKTIKLGYISQKMNVTFTLFEILVAFSQLLFVWTYYSDNKGLAERVN
jgi:hypothetical protein